MTHVRPLGLQCSEAMFVHSRLVKFNPNIPHVQNCLAPVVCERRVYHSRSSPSAYSGRTLFPWNLVKGSSYNAIAVLSKLRCIKIKITCNQNMWHDMATIILCFWSPSPKHRHDLHCHRLDTLISIIASLCRGRHSNYCFYNYRYRIVIN